MRRSISVRNGIDAGTCSDWSMPMSIETIGRGPVCRERCHIRIRAMLLVNSHLSEAIVGFLVYKILK